MIRPVSIIIPVLNEEQNLAILQRTFAGISASDREMLEIIVVDAGSTDSSLELAKQFADQVLACGRGRALQMNSGADVSRGDILLFLHADTRLPEHFARLMDKEFRQSGRSWGRYDVTLSHPAIPFRVIAFFMNLRSRLTAVATGDQAMFMTRQVFDEAGGFPDIALMEDIAMSRRLKKLSQPFCIREKVITSSRKWEQLGILKTTWLMWRLRLAFFFGADPEDLHRIYYGIDPRS